MYILRLCVTFAACCALAFTGCASTPNSLSEEVPAPGQGVLPDLGSLKALSAAGDSFLIQQQGADFAPALGTNNVVTNGTAAEFTPAWQGPAPTLDDAAFCIYRLTYDIADAPITLDLTWNGAAPEQCWIAIADWTADRWKWHSMQGTSSLGLVNPARFCNLDEQCFVAVVTLGDAPSSLAKLGFGEPLPPSPDGYTLFAPLQDTGTYLLDMDGNVVHSWVSNYTAGVSAVLLENGHLLRQANIGNAVFNAGGTGGRIVEFNWDGNVVWYYEHSTSTECTHHDFCRLPNGNILLIVWVLIDDASVVAEGRDPARINSGTFWSEKIIEIEPTLPSGGNIVWEWSAFDHLVQDFDDTKENFSDPQQHPELIDLNFPPGNAGDWIHFNCVNYNEELDQVILTTPFFNEIWIIDHSTTTAEAAGHTGGRYGRGGDLLYRWGNPQSYRRGSQTDKKLFFCHDAHWLEEGQVGAGEVMIFNNQSGLAEGRNYSSVIQLALPSNPDGSYYMADNVYGPVSPSWEFKTDPPENFYSPIMSSAQRLPGGGLLICQGPTGYMWQTDATGTKVWDHQNTYPNLSSPVFQALRYGYDYPGVSGLD